MTYYQGTHYNLFTYGEMVNEKNRCRVQAYAQAMEKTITPDSVVLEIGTGPGFFALLACKLGARHVYAIDPNNSIHIARENAEANGYGERITFFQEMSTQVTLPERADVVVSDMRGTLPWLSHHIPSIQDARERLLAPNGILIPQRDTVWVSIVESPELYGRFTDPWDDNEYGFDLSAARKRAINTFEKGPVKPENLLAESQPWTILDYPTIETLGTRGKATWEMSRSGTIHGLSLWFSSELIEGIGFSNAPDQNQAPIYGQTFFPLEQPVELTTGDVVNLDLQTNLVGQRYIWRWETRIQKAGDPNQVKAHFIQSNFLSKPSTPQEIQAAIL